MRPSNKKTDDHEARSEKIGAAISRVGPKHLMGALGLATAWSIYKWRNKGFVPNGYLERFCVETGESPRQVCDPAVASLMRADLPRRRVHSNGLHATKGRLFVNSE
ncbi:MAG: hypothetical protein V4772_25655 [Pseudomonadota bacterium]